MAIDSASDRKSISGIHLYANGPGVTSLVIATQTWRQAVGYAYSGIKVAEPSEEEAATSSIITKVA